MLYFAIFCLFRRSFLNKSIESYSQKYPSPFTKSPATPINTGGTRGEGLSSPFTTLHPPFTLFRCRSPLKPAAGHQWWLQLGINDGQAIFYKKVFSQNNVRVKGGEGWWRAEATLHLSHPQCLSGLQAKRWRVKGKKESSIFTSRTPHDYWARGVVESEWQSWGILSPDVSFLAWQWHKVALARGNILP